MRLLGPYIKFILAVHSLLTLFIIAFILFIVLSGFSLRCFLLLLYHGITLKPFQLWKQWDRCLQTGPWDAISGIQGNGGIFLLWNCLSLGAGNWVAEKSCDNSLTWFLWRNSLKVTFWRIRGQNYVSPRSLLSFTQWHEINWWDRGRGKCQCKCLQ